MALLDSVNLPPNAKEPEKKPEDSNTTMKHTP